MKKSKRWIGQLYISRDSVRYILAQVSADMVCLISLDGGNRWQDSVEVRNPYHISESEWIEIAHCSCQASDGFKLCK